MSSLISEEILLSDTPAHIGLGRRLPGRISNFLTSPNLSLRLLLIFQMYIQMVPEFDTRPDKLSTRISGLHLYLRDMSPQSPPLFNAFLGFHLIVNGLCTLSDDLDARADPIHKLRFWPPMAASRFSELENDL